MAQDPYRYFRPEARNLLDQFAQGILDLEKNGTSAGAVQRLLRIAHTLKGAARVVRQSAIAERAHAIEDALAPFRDGADDIAREHIDTILAHLDEIGSRIVTLVPVDGADAGNGKMEEMPKSPATKVTTDAPLSVAGGVPRTIRTEIAEMDAVLDGVSETQTRINGLRRSAEAIEQAGHLVDLLGAQLRAPGTSDAARQPAGLSNRAIAIVEELRRKFSGAARDLDAAIAQIDRELRQLRDAAEGLRLVGVDSLLTALARTARDAARALSKDVRFEGSGGDIRLDADVVGIIQGALIQIIRNAVAHGIESESERLHAGKSGAGRIAVNVSRRGPMIVFECSDDGRGIDLAAVRRVAVERGLLSATVNELSAETLVRTLLRGGISTSAKVTDVSGRGVGLDVVREALERVGGDVAVRINPGCGTTFELVIPRSASSVEALIVEADAKGVAIAIPLYGVRRIVRLTVADIASVGTGASILYEQKAVPFIPLAAAFDGTNWSFERAWTAIVVAGRGELAAVGVERLIGTARAIVRPLPDCLNISPIVVGASLDGEGDPQLMLDPDGLVAAAQSSQRDGARPAEGNSAPAKRPVLVVDDSLTTRMLEQSILESAGYDVDVASSGEEALDLVRRKPFALILCDVEMPGIDGFTFIERIRADVSLRDIPAILVSSRSAPEDRQRGRDVGAHGYIVKSEFNQAELLTMIRPMVA
jgi:two-component system, chemotaxis family, sensor kinase CheA